MIHSPPPVLVLVNPQDIVNIASAVRIAKNFGIDRMRLVQPEVFDPYRIEGIAHNTADLVARIEILDSLEQALADLKAVPPIEGYVDYALDEVGGFDERYFMYAEDLEWCWRARRRGWEIWFEPGALFRHVGNASGRAAYGDRRTVAYLRNTNRFFLREHGTAATFAYRAVNAAASAAGLVGLGFAVQRLRRRRGVGRASLRRQSCRPRTAPARQ